MIALTIYRAESLRERIRSVRGMLAAWRQRMRDREELARMTDSELRDARMTPYDARRETGKPFWRA